MSDWLDGLLEPPNPYQVKKGVWPKQVVLVDGEVCSVRSDWVGQGFFYLVDTRNGFMPPIVNLWAWEQRLLLSANTIKSYLTDLAVLLERIDNGGGRLKDLNRRFSTLDVLKKPEIEYLINGLAWKRENGELEKVKLSTYARRLTTVKEFLRYGYERYLDKVTDENRYVRVSKELARVERRFEKATPSRAEIEETTKSPSALSNEQLAVLRFALAPRARHNPFSNDLNGALRYRNIAMISLLIETGIRPAELCLLERTDLFPERQSIWVSKWMADSLDAHTNQIAGYRKRAKFPRKVTVGHKTRGREIKLQPHILDMLQLYIDDHRAAFLKAHQKRRSRYLFLSYKDGGPITVNGVQSVVKHLSAVFPAIGYLTSYTFRHTSVNVSKQVLRKALNNVDALHRDQMIQEFLTTKYGWSPASEMPEHYGRADLNALLAQLSSPLIKNESTFSDTPVIEKPLRDAANDAH